jgi:hypothetical protein
LAWLCAIFPGLTFAQSNPARFSSTASVPPLAGTLFFNRAERDQLNRIRSGPPAPEVEKPVAVRNPSTINGFVRRSDGRATVWVDDEAKQDVDVTTAALLEPMSVGAPLKKSGVRTSSGTRGMSSILQGKSKKKLRISVYLKSIPTLDTR